MSPSPPRPRIALVVAMDEGQCIGRDGGMPWHLPADLRHFRAVTMGHPIVMGRCTWESIGRALPGRRNLVLSSSPTLQAEGAEVVRSPEEALARTADAETVMIIGGAKTYARFLPLADRLYVTRIEARFEGDTFFPDLDLRDWTLVEETRRAADEQNAHALRFQTLDRVRP